MEVYTQAGQKLQLVEPPFGSGGEASVYRIAGKPDYVAKIYKTSKLARRREAKVKAMVGLPKSYTLPANLAWPLGYLEDCSKTFRGFYMKGVSATLNLKNIYAYPSKSVSVKQRLAILVSLCDTFAGLHACNQAVGDGNPENIKVLANCTVALLDTDSFAITSADGKLYRCLVCLPEYPSPEILKAAKAAPYESCSKTFNVETDLHVLAIHIFRMLFNGAHPFQYARIPGLSPSGSSCSIEDRVERGESPYFKQLAGFSVPPFAPAFDTFPPYMREAFKRAFVDGNANPSGRPTAYEWRGLLMNFAHDLTPCSADTDHFYWKNQSSCPYCDADTAYRVHTAKVLSATASAVSPAAPSRAAAAPKLSQSTSGIAPSGVAIAARQVPCPGASALHSRSWKFDYWLFTVLLSIAAVLICLCTPLPSMFYLLVLGFFDTWMPIVGAAVGLGASCAYNHWLVKREAWYHYLLSPLVGIVALFATAIVLSLLWQLLQVLSYLFGVLVVISILFAFVSEL